MDEKVETQGREVTLIKDIQSGTRVCVLPVWGIKADIRPG
jgi:hypothetical protein